MSTKLNTLVATSPRPATATWLPGERARVYRQALVKASSDPKAVLAREQALQVLRMRMPTYRWFEAIRRWLSYHGLSGWIAITYLIFDFGGKFNHDRWFTLAKTGFGVTLFTAIVVTVFAVGLPATIHGLVLWFDPAAKRLMDRWDKAELVATVGLLAWMAAAILFGGSWHSGWFNPFLALCMLGTVGVLIQPRILRIICLSGATLAWVLTGAVHVWRSIHGV